MRLQVSLALRQLLDDWTLLQSDARRTGKIARAGDVSR